MVEGQANFYPPWVQGGTSSGGYCNVLVIWITSLRRGKLVNYYVSGNLGYKLVLRGILL